MNREPSFARVIKNARKDKGFSQKALAKKIGVDFTYLSKLENNRANYSPREEVTSLRSEFKIQNSKFKI